MINKFLGAFSKDIGIDLGTANTLVVLLLILFPVFSYAQEDVQLSGVVEGDGAHFEITNSQYLNIILDSSEPIKLKMESMPKMITIAIEPSLLTLAPSTQITLSGLIPLATYYNYQDDYHNLTEFTSDENGVYTYSQDIATSHFVFIQPRKSTKFIKDDVMGGDCYLIGNWDMDTKTCTLMTDLNETIQIDSNNLTLDGNGHTLMGNDTGAGVYLYNRNGVTIKNINVQHFFYGIFFYLF